MSADNDGTWCKHCAGTGRRRAAYYDQRIGTCEFCGGSGLKHQPKMRAQCECGKKQPRFASAWSAQKWMREHLPTHRPNPVSEGNQP